MDTNKNKILSGINATSLADAVFTSFDGASHVSLASKFYTVDAATKRQLADIKTNPAWRALHEISPQKIQHAEIAQQSLLFIAVKECDLELVQKLLANRIDIFQKDIRANAVETAFRSAAQEYVFEKNPVALEILTILWIQDPARIPDPSASLILLDDAGISRHVFWRNCLSKIAESDAFTSEQLREKIPACMQSIFGTMRCNEKNSACYSKHAS